jgi:hypothetical protein
MTAKMGVICRFATHHPLKKEKALALLFINVYGDFLTYFLHVYGES